MVLSLFARRVALGASVSVTARSAHPAVLSILARRTLFATPRLDFPPPAEASQSRKKKVTHETAENKAGKSTAPRGRPPKGSAEHQPTEGKQPTKEEKRPAHLPENLKPPKRAPGPYFLFYASFVKTQPKGSPRELSKRAGEIWRGYTLAEKQPFYDENEARKAQAKEEREEFFRNTSLSDLKQLNAIRKAQGKTKFHSTNKPSIPPTAFILFSNEFRNSTDGQAVINEMSPEKAYAVRAVVAAADRWKSMSEDEKAPYFERYRKAKEEMKVEQVES